MTEAGENEETYNLRNLDAAINLFHACDKDKDGYITRSDLESLLEELQLDESVDTLLSQLGADSSGRISCSQFVKNAQLTAFTSGHPHSGMDYSDGCMPSSSENSLDRHSGPSIWVSSSETKPCLPSSNNQQRPLPPLPHEAKPPNGKPSNMIHASTNPIDSFAMNSLTKTIEDLQQKLEEVTRKKNKILYEKMKQQQQTEGGKVVGASNEVKSGNDDKSFLDWTLQCQDYEEQIVELHSVIAELTRNSEFERHGVILEETEVESLISSNDDGLYEEEEDEEDYTSLAFERALQDPKTGASSSGSSKFSSEVHLAAPDVDYAAELFALQSQLDETRNDNERLNELLDERDEKLTMAEATLADLSAERDRFKRQLEDIHCTVEYQEAKMDSQAKINSAAFRSSSERRSLRKKRNEKRLEASAKNSKDKSSNSYKQSVSNSANHPAASPYRRSIPDLEVEVEKLSSKIDHLRSQNNVLAISLDDSKNFTDRLSIILNKHESNNSALSLSLNYCDHIVESYDVLVALLETEIGILSANHEAIPTQNQHQLINGDLALQRATSNRKSAEKVAKHLLARVLNRSDSGISESGVHHSQHTWDSSGYSQTGSSTSTTSSLLNDSEFTKMDELKLRDHISQLKTIRASIQSSVVEVESTYTDEFAQRKKNDKSPSRRRAPSKVSNLEHAVVQQELMANKEERSDLKAKIYLLEKEKSKLYLELEERSSRESVLRTHISHLQEELGELERDMGPRGGHLMRSSPRGSDSREEVLKQRVVYLLATLDKFNRSHEQRHQRSEALIGDLKRVNSTLSEALEKKKLKYFRLKKLEHQLMLSSSSTSAQQQN